MTSGEGPTNCGPGLVHAHGDCCQVEKAYNETGLLNVAGEFGVLGEETVTCAFELAGKGVSQQLRKSYQGGSSGHHARRQS